VLQSIEMHRQIPISYKKIIWYTIFSIWLVAWFSGTTSVFGQRAFAVLHSACSWRVTTYVSIPSATGQST